MTTDRDRVEAACRRRFPSWDDPQAWSEGARRNMRLEVADFIGAADALAPPPVPLGREAVARAVRGEMQQLGCLNKPCPAKDCMCKRIAAAVLALLPAAPLPVPEDKRWDWRDAWCEYRDAHVGRPAPTPMNAFVAGWEALRQLPAPPADTGDGGAEPENWATVEMVADRDRRVRELEQALRPFAIRMPPDRRDDDFYRPLEPFSRVGDHRRARALIGGGSYD